MKQSHLEICGFIFLLVTVGCATTPPPPPAPILDANYRMEMRSRYSIENKQIIEKIKGYTIGSTTINEFEMNNRWLTPPTSEKSKWVTHLIQRQMRASRYQDGSFKQDAVYYLGIGFKIGPALAPNYPYRHVFDIDCVMIFINSVLKEIRWQPQVKLVSNPVPAGMTSKVLQLEDQEYSGEWNYAASWYYWTN